MSTKAPLSTIATVHTGTRLSELTSPITVLIVSQTAIFYSLSGLLLLGSLLGIGGLIKINFMRTGIFSLPQSPFFVLQKGIEGGLEEIVVCGVVCIVYSILPLRVLLNLKQVLVQHVGKNVPVVVGGSATLSLADRYLL